MSIDPLRARLLKAGKETKGPVVYWMSRDQRVGDNWALIFAEQAARAQKAPLWVVFCLVPQFLSAGHRQYDFLLSGLEELAGRLAEAGIPFQVLAGDPAAKIPEFIDACRAGLLVTDFDPLRIKRQWKQAVSERTLRVKCGRILTIRLAKVEQRLLKRSAGEQT